MRTKTEKLIEKLWGNDSVKDVLIKTENILYSKSKSMRKSSFVPVLITDDMFSVENFGKIYSGIVSGSPYHCNKNRIDYLELVFPKDNDEDEKLFFSSPLRAASTVNRFNGTMLISLSEYEGDDLTSSDSIKNLLNFCDLNRNNIRFVFHLPVGFTTKKQLLSLMGCVFPVVELKLEKPGEGKCFEYVVSEIRDKGVFLDEQTSVYLKKFIIPMIITNDSFVGYHSLNLFIDRLMLETQLDKGGSYTVTLRNMINLFEKISMEASNSKSSRIGF